MVFLTHFATFEKKIQFSDYGPMTLLFQDECGGLEVFSHQFSKWIPVNPKPEAILMNIGDIFEILTAGMLPAAL